MPIPARIRIGRSLGPAINGSREPLQLRDGALDGADVDAKGKLATVSAASLSIRRSTP